MAEIQRHRPARGIDCDENLHSYMIRDKFGSCVKYNDHIAAVAALTAERDALKEQVARLSAEPTHKESLILSQRCSYWNEDYSYNTAQKYALKDFIAARAKKEQP